MCGAVDVGILPDLVHNDILNGAPVALKLHGDDPCPDLQHQASRSAAINICTTL